MESPLVTTQWLAENLAHEKLVLLDASMEQVIGRELVIYEQPLFIPNSRNMDIEQHFIEPNIASIHPFPLEQQFTAEAQNLGINADSIVVIYDNQGIYSSPRAWWIFQAMGFHNAYVLDGGLPKWLAEQRETTTTTYTAEALGNIVGSLQANAVCDASYVVDNIDNPSVLILDARSRARFLGQAKEPRKGIRSGCIPHSVNLPFLEVLHNDSYKDQASLQKIFTEMVTEDHTQLVFSCGSGITACIILLAAVIAGFSNTVLYDGSWAEWGGNYALPIE